MNPNRVFVLLAAVLAWVTSAVAQNESLAAIFTNASATSKVHRTVVPRRSSIIFISCRGLALGDLSCYGQTNFQTPNLDRIATEGTRFTSYYAAGDNLPQAQATLMTGDDTADLSSDITVPARLKVAGYHTGLIGEWTLGSQPWRQGFDEFAGFFSEQEADNYYSDFVRRYNPRGIYNETNHTLEPFIGNQEIYDNTGNNKGIFIPDLLMKAASNFVKENNPDRSNHYRPFFLLVNLPIPHSVTPGKDDYPVPTDAPFTDEPWPQAAKNRAALITRFDDGVGRLLEQLKSVDMTNNVAIFLTGAVAPEKFADASLNFLKLKGEIRGGESEERLHVPMIVRWPGHVPAGRVSNTRWSPMDFAPTAMDIAYALPTANANFKGISVLPALLGQLSTNTGAIPKRADRP